MVLFVKQAFSPFILKLLGPIRTLIVQIGQTQQKQRETPSQVHVCALERSPQTTERYKGNNQERSEAESHRMLQSWRDPGAPGLFM